MSTQFKINPHRLKSAAKLLAAGYEVHVASDGWLVVVGDNWEASFAPNDGNDVFVGNVPQQVCDLAE